MARTLSAGSGKIKPKAALTKGATSATLSAVTGSIKTFYPKSVHSKEAFR
jgi:hypothetical protein